MRLVINDLRRRREALRFEAEEAEARIKVLAVDVAASERVIQVYEPSLAPDATKKAFRCKEAVQMPEHLAEMNKSEALAITTFEVRAP